MISFLTHLGAQVGPWLYLLVAALAFGESALLIGMVLPGETALLIGGYFSHQGVLSLPVMLAVAVTAAIAGDAVGFGLGRRYGTQLRASVFGSRIGAHRWTAVDAFLLRHRGKAVLLARLTAILRALTPMAAGMSGMRYRTFMIWNVVGGVVWGGGCVLLGWAFASTLTRVGHWLSWAPLAMLAIGVFAALLVHRQRRMREPVASTPTEVPAVTAGVKA